MKAAFLMLVFSLSAAAQPPSRVSQTFLFAGTAMDIGSTIVPHASGIREGNPLLGSSRIRQSAIMTGSVIGVNHLTKKIASSGHPRLATFLNFAIGGVHFAAAGSNIRLVRGFR